MFRYFYLITLGQEGVEPVDQLAVALEERRNSTDDAGRVDLLALEGLHDLEEFIINLGLIPKFGLDLVEVEERVLDLRVSGVSAEIVGVGPRGRVYPWRRAAKAAARAVWGGFWGNYPGFGRRSRGRDEARAGSGRRGSGGSRDTAVML